MASLLDELGTGLNDGGKNLRWAFAEMSPFFQSARELTQTLAGRRQNSRGSSTTSAGSPTSSHSTIASWRAS